MADKEKVKKGLECCAVQYVTPEAVRHCGICPYDRELNGEMDFDCINDLLCDALSLLKAQEPRLITKDDFEKADAWGTIPAWIEYNPAIEGAEPGWAIICSDILGSPFKKAWTARPTDEQREAVMWND